MFLSACTHVLEIWGRYVGGRELLQKKSRCLREPLLQPSLGAASMLIANGLSEFVAQSPLTEVFILLLLTVLSGKWAVHCRYFPCPCHPPLYLAVLWHRLLAASPIPFQFSASLEQPPSLEYASYCR